MHLDLIAYGPSTINTNALLSTAFGPPIYGEILLGPHCISVHISGINRFGPDSIWAEYY